MSGEAPERFRFSVAYEPAVLKSAVRAYLWRALASDHNWFSTATIFVVVVGVGLLLFARELNFLTGLFAGLAATLALLLVAIAWLHWRGMAAKLKRMKEPRAAFVLSDEALEVETEEGSGRFPWKAFRQIWKFREVWLLMMDLNRFVTLPLAGVPAEALQFLDAKIQPRPFGAA